MPEYPTGSQKKPGRLRVLNFGSLNLDYVYAVDHIVQPGETLSAFSRAVYYGGKGLNQSVAAARAGVEVFHAGKIGTDGEVRHRRFFHPKKRGRDRAYVHSGGSKWAEQHRTVWREQPDH